jgi:hypothetical protein
MTTVGGNESYMEEIYGEISDDKKISLSLSLSLSLSVTRKDLSIMIMLRRR